MGKRWKITGALFLAAGLALTGCSGGSSQGAEDTVAVQSVSMLAGLGSVGMQEKYSGEVVAQQTQEINKDAERSVAELKVAVGDAVKKGDVLFSYDTDELQLSIENGKLELEQIQNTIDSTKRQITQLEKDRRKAPASEKLSYSLEIQTLEAEIKENEYNQKTKKVELERLEKSLNETDVLSEIDGIVQSINENGETDNMGNPQAYIVLMETGTYRVKGTVNEMNYPNLSGMVGSGVLIRSRVDENQTWNGTLEEIDTENPDTDTNNYYVSSDSGGEQASKYPFYITLDSSDGLMMGQHVFIELNQGQEQEKEGLWLPSAYLEMGDDGAYAWAASDRDKLEKRSVTLGEYNEEMEEYQILDGLAADDYIAIPDESLKEGQAVTRYDEGSFVPEGGGDVAPVEGDGALPEGGDVAPVEGDGALPEGGDVEPMEGGEVFPEGDEVAPAEGGEALPEDGAESGFTEDIPADGAETEAE